MRSIVVKFVLVAAMLGLAGGMLVREAASSRPGMFLYPVKNSLQDLAELFSNTTVIWVPVAVPNDAGPQSTALPATGSPQPAPDGSQPRQTGQPASKATATRGVQPVMEPVIGRDMDTVRVEPSPSPVSGPGDEDEPGPTQVPATSEAGGEAADFNPSTLVPGDVGQPGLFQTSGSGSQDGTSDRDSSETSDHHSDHNDDEYDD